MLKFFNNQTQISSKGTLSLRIAAENESIADKNESLSAVEWVSFAFDNPAGSHARTRTGFPGLRAALRCLGGPNAEMVSHPNVLVSFIALLWPPDDVVDWVKTRAATGLSLEIFLGNRPLDWAPLLSEMLVRSLRDRDLTRYLSGWLRGHFISQADLANAMAPAVRPSRR